MPFAAAAIGLFAVAWFVADVRWTLNLARQSMDTLRTYAGTGARDAHLAGADGPLFRLVEQAREKLPRDPARVFVLATEPYFRARAAYYLLPHRAWYDLHRSGVPESPLLRAGDYVFVYRRRGVQYHQAAQRLRWEGSRDIPAELSLVTPDGALFRVLEVPR